VDGERIGDRDYRLAAGAAYLIRLGKRKFLQLAVH